MLNEKTEATCCECGTVKKIETFFSNTSNTVEGLDDERRSWLKVNNRWMCGPCHYKLYKTLQSINPRG